jgi:hypothetical protein
MTSSASEGDHELPDLEKRVRFASPEQLRAEADAFYADLKVEEDRGIGGANVMLACALERTVIHAEGAALLEEVILRRPEALGFRKAGPDQPSNAILNHIRKGSLVLEQVLGGPTG